MVLLTNNLGDVVEEPAVNSCQLEKLLDVHASQEGFTQMENAFGIWNGQFAPQKIEIPQLATVGFRILDLIVASASTNPRRGDFPIGTQPKPFDLQRAQRLLQRLLERPADRHRLAHTLHLSRQHRVGLREFFEGEARAFHHDVINRRLETRGRLARDVVAHLVERVTHGKLRGDFGNGEARRLARQRRAARHARVHLDDDHAAGVGMHGELDVAPARLHADLADDRERRIAHHLELAVRQRLDRRDRDRVARVNAHRVHVFDGADDHAVVRVVAHHLHLEFLPPEERLLDEHLAHRRHVQPARDDRFKFLAIVSDAAARAAERESRPDDERHRADLRRHRAPLLHRVRHAGGRHIETDLQHRVLKCEPVLALVNRRRLRADHAHAVFLQHAEFVELHRAVQRRLAAERRQQRVRLLRDDDFFHHLRRDRLDVSAVRKLRVRHDRRRIRVHEDDRVALLLERLTGLHA